MGCRIYREEDYHVTGWSGGKTKELFISPLSSSYGERNFELRISSATVETETSLFTKLTNIDRLLIVLKGNISISHKGEPFHELPPLTGDYFTGEEITKSRGCCTDFNVMLRRGSYQSVGHHILTSFPVSLQEEKGRLFLYAVEGTFEIRQEKKLEILGPGELFSSEKTGTLDIRQIDPGILIQVEIKY
ncbi:MAG TPA: HutD family protein [Veillonellaceae bacterium]|nr:HutD family protein [Veillonellaceae bacterium]